MPALVRGKLFPGVLAVAIGGCEAFLGLLARVGIAVIGESVQRQLGLESFLKGVVVGPFELFSLGTLHKQHIGRRTTSAYATIRRATRECGRRATVAFCRLHDGAQKVKDRTVSGCLSILFFGEAVYRTLAYTGTEILVPNEYR